MTARSYILLRKGAFYILSARTSPFITAYTVSPATLLMPNLLVIFLRCEITVVSEMHSLSAISLLISPCTTSWSTSISRCDRSGCSSIPTGWVVSATLHQPIVRIGPRGGDCVPCWSVNNVCQWAWTGGQCLASG